MKWSWRLYGDKASILTCDDPERFYLNVWYILFEDLGHLKIKLNEAWMVFPPPFAEGVGSSDGIWWDWISNCHWRCSAIIFILDLAFLSFVFDVFAALFVVWRFSNIHINYSWKQKFPSISRGGCFGKILIQAECGPISERKKLWIEYILTL